MACCSLAITFIFSRNNCDAAVRQCLAAGLKLTNTEERSEIRRVISRNIKNLAEEDLVVLGYYEWADALERGIAAHHAGLLPAFKVTVEELFQRGFVKAVFATETLALGINMPARTVVLEKLSKWNGEGHVAISPGEYTQGILKLLINRKGMMENMETEPSGETLITALIPTRGLIGFETEIVNLTSGHCIMSHLFREYGPHAGEIVTRTTGTLVSMEAGVATTYSLQALEDRGILFVGPNDAIYGGMLVGENPRVGDMPVNPVKEKHLDNMRSSGKDKTSKLTPPIRFSLERAIEYIDADELVEATPLNIRLRKRLLDEGARKRAAKGIKGEDRSNRGK